MRIFCFFVTQNQTQISSKTRRFLKIAIPKSANSRWRSDAYCIFIMLVYRTSCFQSAFGGVSGRYDGGAWCIYGRCDYDDDVGRSYVKQHQGHPVRRRLWIYQRMGRVCWRDEKPVRSAGIPADVLYQHHLQTALWLGIRRGICHPSGSQVPLSHAVYPW